MTFSHTHTHEGPRKVCKPTAAELATYERLSADLKGPNREDALRQIVAMATAIIDRAGRERGVTSVVDWSADG